MTEHVVALLLACPLSRIVNTLFADYLCSADANHYGIDFTMFKIRDMDTQAVLFEIRKPEAEENAEDSADAQRFVQYNFPPAFLRLKTVGAT